MANTHLWFSMLRSHPRCSTEPTYCTSAFSLQPVLIIAGLSGSFSLTLPHLIAVLWRIHGHYVLVIHIGHIGSWRFILKVLLASHKHAHLRSATHWTHHAVHTASMLTSHCASTSACFHRLKLLLLLLFHHRQLVLIQVLLITGVHLLHLEHIIIGSVVSLAP